MTEETYELLQSDQLHYCVIKGYYFDVVKELIPSKEKMFKHILRTTDSNN